MIYFDEKVVAQVLEMTKNSKDCANIYYDLLRIDWAKDRVNAGRDYGEAYRLNDELRKKYQSIDAMLNIANTFSVPSPQTTKAFTPSDAIIADLTQDYYGILYEAALKKKLDQKCKRIHQIRRLTEERVWHGQEYI